MHLALLASGLTGCGLVVRPGRVETREPGAALRAFKRALGLGKEAVVEIDTGPIRASELEAIPEENLSAWRHEIVQADALFGEAERVAGGLRLASLPTAKTRPAQLARARGLILLDRLAEAEGIVDALLDEEATYFPATALRARLRYAQKRFAEAVRLYRESCLRVPGDEELRRGLCFALLRLPSESRRSEGLRLALELVENGGRPVRDAARLANWAIENEQFGRAITFLRAGLVRAPSEPSLVYLIARTYWESARFAEAASMLEPLCAPGSKVRAEALLLRLRAFRALERYGEAWACWQELSSPELASAVEAAGSERIAQLGASLDEERRGLRRVAFSPTELRILVLFDADATRRRAAIDRLAGFAGGKVDAILARVQRNDDDPSMRSRAMQLRFERNRRLADPLVAGLSDGHARVRARAAIILGEHHGTLVCRALHAALGREADPETFRAMHVALARASGISAFLELDAEESAAGRNACVADWERKLTGAGILDARDPEPEGGGR